MSEERSFFFTYPLFGGQDKLSFGALGVPCAGALKACIGNTRVERTSSENVWVCPHHDVGHHRSRTRPRREYSRCVYAPARACNSPSRSVRDTERVSTEVVRERRIARDIPAAAGSRSARVNEDEPVLVGESGEIRLRVVDLSAGGALVHGNYERRVGSDRGRLVVVQADVCRVRADICGDLLKRASKSVDRRRRTEQQQSGRYRVHGGDVG